MRKYISKFAKNPLIAGSFFLLSGGIVANLFNFLFNLSMSRNLEVGDYGVLISLISIITLLSIPAGALTPTIVTVGGKYFSNKENKVLHAFYMRLAKILIFCGGLLVIVFFLMSGTLSTFFKIKDQSLFAYSSIAIVLSYFITLHNSFLQAKLSFKTLSLVNTSSSFSKFVLSFAFILLGYGLGGASLGLFLSFLVAVLVGGFFLKDVIFFKSKESGQFAYKELIAYGLPSAAMMLALSSFVSTDILFVKHFFSEQEAGLYAGLSLIGRVIFFISAPVSTVMFPVIVNRFNKKEAYKHILLSALGIVCSISTALIVFYYLFPKFTILFFLKKTEYLSIERYLVPFGFFIMLYSLLYIFAYYFLSIKSKKMCWVFVGGALSQCVLLTFFHKDFNEIIYISLFVVSLLFAYSAYYVKFKN
jgi:O-antigen/teichoic acid export membrane protein